LYRYRGIIAALFFILVLAFARPTKNRIYPAVFIATGLAIRIWAIGYIGKEARDNKFSTKQKIVNGPYRYLKHPLYWGNLFLVIGVLCLFGVPQWLFILLILVFCVEYLLIIGAEKDYLKTLPKINKKFRVNNIKYELSTIGILIIIYFIYHYIK